MPDREKVIRGLQNLRDAIATDFIHEADQAVGTIDDAIALLKEQEAVVRCKDCKHESYCSIHETKFSDDWFCADGERR